MRIGHRYPAELQALLQDAEGHTRRHSHPGVGCEHLLLAVTAAHDPLGAALRSLGLTPEHIDRALATVLARPRRALFEGVDGPALAVLGIDLHAMRRSAEELVSGREPRPGPETGPRRALRRRHTPRTGAYPVTGRARICLRVAQTAPGPDPLSLAVGARLAMAVLDVPGGLIGPILAEMGLAATDLRAEVRAVARRAEN